MKKFTVFIYILLLFQFCQFQQDTIGYEEETQSGFTALEKEVLSSSNRFGLSLFRTLAGNGTQSNIFISPVSVSMALGMTLNGAAGNTYQSMQQALNWQEFSNDEINEAYKSLIHILINMDEQVAMELANSIWYRQGFDVLQSFIDVNREFFDAEVRDLDFTDPAAPDIINGWISGKTHGKIDNVIDQIGPLVVMYLINAIYFKASWMYAFDADQTREEFFTTATGEPVPVQMMRHRWEHPYFENDDFQAVDLAYGSGKFSMTILLPKYGRSLNGLVNMLDDINWKTWMNSFHADSVDLFLPRFKMTYRELLNDALSSMGMGIAFTESADFTRIRGLGGILISRVIHKSFVEVNEEGTEAAAVSVVEMELTSIQPDAVPTMRMDRPFLFAIRERENGTILFLGALNDPREQE